MKASRSKKRRKVVDVDLKEIDGILDGAREHPLSETDCAKVRAALHAMAEQLMRRSRSTEKLGEVFPEAPEAPEDKNPDDLAEKEQGDSKPRAPGHGRNPAAAFTGARKVRIEHPEMEQGCLCPGCQKGKVYEKEPTAAVRFASQPPIQATVYERQRFRCNLCGETFTAPEPEGVGAEKYDATVASMVAQMKYGHGIPFNRLESLQAQMGVPLPASTQWELVRDAAEQMKPVLEELIWQAAQGDRLHNDDTGMKVLKIERPEDDDRTGVFTSGIMSVVDEHTIALFFTGTKHAGENIRDVLLLRAGELEAPILMCDALSWNDSKLGDLEVVLANCLAHGRRQFVDLADNFPAEARYMLEALGEVYGHDAKARELKLNPQERLEFHQKHSAPVMENLHKWISSQLDEKRVEPNCPLGKAMKYMLRHWGPLTLFLRRAGAPIDNNLTERALKKAVLHRKNALFYRTLNGAQVGDLFMSLIHTCELNGVNSFDYLTELQRNALDVHKDPGAWMPWNYTLARAAPG